jgi:phosphomethylpyrimidine synthase
MSLLLRNNALRELCGAHLPALSREEELPESLLRAALEQGSMALLGNPAHPGLAPVLIGQPARVKVNANIGNSAMRNSIPCELRKLEAALAAGSDTVMDLSTAGDLAAIRRAMLDACPRPLGTVPLYAVAQKYIDAGKDPALFEPRELLDEVAAQAGQGVDFMTLHCGITERAARWAAEKNGRALGIVSRGGRHTGALDARAAPGKSPAGAL